jgi:hypothetical protein
LQNQSIQRQEAVEKEKNEGGQGDGKEFTMNPEPPPVQRKFENRLRAKNAQRMEIQAKLAIGEPNDKYEQEADATAARVVQQINSPTTSQSQPVQRKFENRLRAKNAQKMAIQAKLAIGEPNDKYEQEADANAAMVVQQINSSTNASTTSQSQPVQRQGMEEDEELQMKPLVQRSENLGGGEASTDLESAIQSARGSGQSLDANLQQSMGQAMGADFSGVKVHTDSQSDQLNKSIQAKAFTTGQDLFFRQGAYEPSSRGGQELIAHELTHVVQQNGVAVQRSLSSLPQLPQHHNTETSSTIEPAIQTKVEITENHQVSSEENDSNETGMPDSLKTGIESLSGMAMDDVKVHYNSTKPAEMQALAYTQGTDIHVASGQEKHLPHEAWHVVQQKQGRVEPSIQMKGIYANVDLMLEREADIMGEKANNLSSVEARLPSASQSANSSKLLGQPLLQKSPIQGAPVRQFVCGSSGSNTPPTLDAVINTSAKSSPSTIADQLMGSSEAFSELRGVADKEVNETFGKKGGVEYKDKPKTGGGTGPAYYKDGVTYFDPNAPMPATVLNIVFETANAAQAGKFQKVESDFDKGILMDIPMESYIDNPSLLGAYADDYNSPASKRSLIQEYYEWNSFLLAKNALADLSKQYTSEVASITWESSFGEVLKCKNFEEYYKLSGNTHRKAVQGTLEQASKPKQDSSGKQQVDISKLF